VYWTILLQNTVFEDVVGTLIYTGINFNFAADASLLNVVYCTYRIFCVHITNTKQNLRISGDVKL